MPKRRPPFALPPPGDGPDDGPPGLSRTEISFYIKDMAQSMAGLAAGQGDDVLAYLLHLAAAEAEHVANRM